MRALPLSLAFLLSAPLAGTPAIAEQSTEVNGYVIHYNALTTDFLSPEVARLYGIPRSKNRGMLNVTVLKNHMGLASLPVRAKVSVSAINLSNQTKAMIPREVMDGGAIYYIAEFSVTDEETLTFNIHVVPEGDTDHVLSFRQQFHTQ